MEQRSLVEQLAHDVGQWFPELGGRSIAVSEVAPFSDQTNVPSLPLAFVALVSEEGNQTKNGGGNIELTPDIIVQFMFTPVKHTRANGETLPFFAFYNYEPLRNKLLHMMQGWRTPSNGAISYRSLDVEANEYAVHVTFRFRVTERWCRPEDEEAVAVLTASSITTTVVPPRSLCCPDDSLCPEPEDPCDAARLANPYAKENQDG